MLAFTLDNPPGSRQLVIALSVHDYLALIVGDAVRHRALAGGGGAINGDNGNGMASHQNSSSLVIDAKASK